MKLKLGATKKIGGLNKDKLKGSGTRDSNAHEHLCIQNKPQSVHASSVEKGVVRDKDGYSIQPAERERGNGGELFTIEPAPRRVVRGPMPHLGIAPAWPRSAGQPAR